MKKCHTARIIKLVAVITLTLLSRNIKADIPDPYGKSHRNGRPPFGEVNCEPSPQTDGLENLSLVIPGVIVAGVVTASFLALRAIRRAA